MPCVVWFGIVDRVCELCIFSIVYVLIKLENPPACQKVECLHLCSMNDWHLAQPLPFSQKNWPQHKSFCKASHQAEKTEFVKSTLLFSLADAPTTDLEILNMIVGTIVQNSLQSHQFCSKRTPTIAEQNLYCYEPRCMAW